MGLADIVRKVTNNLGSPYAIYDLEDNVVSNESCFVLPVARSVDEYIAAFGRRVLLHSQTRLEDGYILQYVKDPSLRYFVNSLLPIDLSGQVVVYKGYLFQINATGTITRETTVVDATTGIQTKSWTTIIADLALYIERKDWTMEMPRRAIPRNQKGYEHVVCQNRGLIQKGDHLTTVDSHYIIQNRSTILRDNMLDLQVGIARDG